MTFKKVQEPKQIGIQMVNGKEIPILQPEVHVELKNKKTGKDYNSEDEAKQDVADPNTDTKEEDIEQNVQVKVQQLPDFKGDVKYD
jgi:hypothetical protein|tara:strand:+ start:227 stop:484 length:258 start_codon:yes stop_codon:yes gene_type:complete